METLIHVDRSIRPVYPDCVKEVLHPELEVTGPAEYDITSVELWLHQYQKNGSIQGTMIYEYLLEKNMLESCLGLADLLAIQAKGINFFRRHFDDKKVLRAYGWKSVVRRHTNHLGSPAFDVPLICHDTTKVVLYWDYLHGSHIYNTSPALRFASK